MMPIEAIRKIREQETRLERIATQERVITAALYRLAANTSIPTDTATIVDFATKTFDTQDRVTTGASWKFTARIGGYYYVSTQVMLELNTAFIAEEQFFVDLYVSGTRYLTLSFANNLSGNVFPVGGGSALIYLAADDYVDVRVTQRSGLTLNMYTAGSKDMYSWVSVFKI
jgi:hypothetical protein